MTPRTDINAKRDVFSTKRVIILNNFQLTDIAITNYTDIA